MDSLTITTIFILCILYLIYFFGKWKIREIMMKKLAKDLNLSFIKKNNILEIEGRINNNNIFIFESIVFVPAPTHAFNNPGDRAKVTRKKIEIKINEKNIYEETCTLIFPLPKTIKKIILNELKNN